MEEDSSRSGKASSIHKYTEDSNTHNLVKVKPDKRMGEDSSSPDRDRHMEGEDKPGMEEDRLGKASSLHRILEADSRTKTGEEGVETMGLTGIRVNDRSRPAPARTFLWLGHSHLGQLQMTRTDTTRVSTRSIAYTEPRRERTSTSRWRTLRNRIVFCSPFPCEHSIYGC